MSEQTKEFFATITVDAEGSLQLKTNVQKKDAIYMMTLAIQTMLNDEVVGEVEEGVEA